MVHEGDPGEAGTLRRPGPLDDRVERHPQLREKEVELGHLTTVLITVVGTLPRIRI